MTNWMYTRGCWVHWIRSWTGQTRAWQVRGDGLHVSLVGPRKTVRACAGLAESYNSLSLGSTVTIALLILILLILIVVFKT